MATESVFDLKGLETICDFTIPDIDKRRIVINILKHWFSNPISPTVAVRQRFTQGWHSTNEYLIIERRAGWVYEIEELKVACKLGGSIKYSHAYIKGVGKLLDPITFNLSHIDITERVCEYFIKNGMQNADVTWVNLKKYFKFKDTILDEKMLEKDLMILRIKGGLINDKETTD